MDKQSIHNLLVDYVSNRVDADGYGKLMDLIAASNEDAELYSFMERVWNSSAMGQPFSELQAQLLYQRIIQDKRFTGQKSPVEPIVGKLWYKIAVAAAVLIVLSVVLFFFMQKTFFLKSDMDHLTAQDIAPGSNKAVLTLGNGKQIILNDAGLGTLAKQGGITISKTADGQLVYDLSVPDGNVRGKSAHREIYNTVATPKGGQYQVKLPDGTVVWLNSASSLKFPTAFKFRDNREVELTGEAYFEVVHNQKQPFVVKTRGQEVEVLGTHFNVNSYDNEPSIKTSLLEGSVCVSTISLVTNEKVILKPGQQAVLSAGIQVINADVAAAVAWKNGFFHFKNADLYTVFRQLSRWYDVEVIYQTERMNDEFVGDIPRTATLATALKILNLGGVRYKIDGKKIIITK